VIVPRLPGPLTANPVSYNRPGEFSFEQQLFLSDHISTVPTANSYYRDRFSHTEGQASFPLDCAWEMIVILYPAL